MSYVWKQKGDSCARNVGRFSAARSLSRGTFLICIASRQNVSGVMFAANVTVQRIALLFTCANITRKIKHQQ